MLRFVSVVGFALLIGLLFAGPVLADDWDPPRGEWTRGSPGTTYARWELSLIHISEPTRQKLIAYAVFCLKKFF